MTQRDCLRIIGKIIAGNSQNKLSDIQFIKHLLINTTFFRSSAFHSLYLKLVYIYLHINLKKQNDQWLHKV